MQGALACTMGQTSLLILIPTNVAENLANIRLSFVDFRLDFWWLLLKQNRVLVGILYFWLLDEATSHQEFLVATHQNTYTHSFQLTGSIVLIIGSYW